jgi:glycosyltransferase involved in cell wall biosynthesis
MQISLIITTYNWKEALALSLLSVFRQTTLPSEVIVADDGSAQDTREVVNDLTATAPIPVIHSWQEDRGFRLAKSRNKAIALARGEYIVLIDGDIVLESHFIEDHSKFAQKGCFAQGSRVLLGEELSRRFLTDKQYKVSFCNGGVENRKNSIRSNMLARLLSFRCNQIRGVKTCNFAFWRHDAIRVNGFNEEFEGWGREDSEFTARLLNLGVQRQNIRFNALGYHLFHPMKDRKRLAMNDRILEQTISNKLDWCTKGIDQYMGTTIS